MISAVETSIEPPDLDQADEPDDESQQVHLSIWLTECDGTARNASMVLPGSATDRQLADALIQCVRGCATLRGPGLATAVERRIR
ncbi:MAG: hypothetical protein ACRDSF_00470 [Pseudonocardiaceae bacterium]